MTILFNDLFPNLPEELFYEVGKDALLLYLGLREASGGCQVCEKAAYVAALCGLRGRDNFRSACAELEASGLVRFETRPDEYSTMTVAIFLRQLPIKRHDRLAPQDWSKLRDEVFRRDGNTCQYCGATERRLECDHVIPLSQGGTNEIGNLITACADCNRSKRAKSLEDWRGRQSA